ncbi:MAG TPA: LPXTG cell wall anchor domain-containing protein [Rubrobacter sp.]|nr:LPXTG cell wall anchor domain-containing protein [Rubrobacter sp.]
MRKVMLLAAMLAMVLAAAAPAFAQAVGGNVDVQYVDCSQVQAAAAAQGQYGDASADADASAGDFASAANAEAVASIAQELGITQAQVNACLGGIDNDTTTGGGGGGGTTTVTVTSTSTSTSTASASSSASASAASELPSTGGASLFALGAGALLVAGGLLARRIVR